MSADVWDQRAFKVLFVLVLLFAAPTLWSWFAPIETPLVQVGLSAKTGRDPASAPVATPHSSKLSKPVTLEWNFGSREFTKEIQGTHLRLKGLVKGLKANSIANETNGFTASVFLTGTQFTTDFIELNEGSNQIHVDLVDAQGKKISKKIEVVRRTPAHQ